jgi:uncharacterized membrane protein YbhN (UPF0104 family)
MAALTVSGLAALGLATTLRHRIGLVSPDRYPRVRDTLAALLDAVRLGLRSRIALPAFVLTVLLWALMYLVWVAIVWALGLRLGPEQIMWVYLLFFPVNILPIKGIASVGTHHVAWQISFQIVGVPLSQAAAAAFGAHLITMAVTILVGLAALPGLARDRKRSATDPLPSLRPPSSRD